MEVVVEDANIIIDLLNTGLIRYCNMLGISFHTTNLVNLEIINVEQRKIMDIAVKNKMILIDSFEGEDMINLIIEHSRYSGKTNLSSGDCSVMLLAEKLKCRLLTTDQKLKRQAEARNITVNGLLWLTDLMVDKKVLSTEEMITLLTRLKETNHSAPIHLIDERIEKYKKLI